MAIIGRYNFTEYQTALQRGNCDPPRVLTPFFKIDRVSFNRMKHESDSLDLEKVRRRLGRETFRHLRGSLGFTLRHAHWFFPAYRFFVGRVVNDEWLAMVDWGKFHRDHLIHQVMSTYVGMSLLRNDKLFAHNPRPSDFAGDTLLDKCIDALLNSRKCRYLIEYLEEMGASDSYLDGSAFSKRLWKSIFVDTFFLAVLFHDIGYPWQFINQIDRGLRPHSPTENPIDLNVDKIIENYGQRLVFSPFSGYRKPDATEPANWLKRFRQLLGEGLNETHGVPGAMALLHLNDSIRQSFAGDDDVPIRRFCIEWAAMAVMMHDLAKLYAKVEDGSVIQKNPQLRLSMANDPLSFLLTLTDQIQDFERPDASFMTAGPKAAKATYNSRCKSVQLDWDNSQGILKITYQYENPGDYISNRDRYLPKNQLLYFHPSNGYLEYTNIGITRIKLDADLLPPP